MDGVDQSSRLSPGRTRRRKRANPSDANEQNNSSRQSDRSSSASAFPFGVNIPSYYRDDSPRPDLSQANDGVVSAQLCKSPDDMRAQDLNTTNTGINERVDGVGEEDQAVNDAAKAPADGKTDHEPDASTSKLDSTKTTGDAEEGPNTKRHKAFVSALERHGSSARAWNDIASDLKWEVGDVKVYAYSYFRALVRGRKMVACNSLVGDDDVAKNRLGGGDPTSYSTWSLQELVLLDSLMIQHCTDLTCLEVNEGGKGGDDRAVAVRQRTLWQKIASRIPGKTALACKKEGISRLLRVYSEQDGARGNTT